jgi:hypothetical protein
LSVEECPDCGAPMRNGKCNYCQSSELGKSIWNEGKCRNCGAGFHKNLIRDKQNQFVCRYCGWPVKDKPIQDPTSSTPPDPDPLPPNSPAATINSSSSGEIGNFGISGLIIVSLTGIMAFALLGPILTMNLISRTSPNITSTNHPIDVPTYTPGASIILLGGAFVAGIILTFAILRNRHRRELQRQRKLLEQPR